MGSIKGGSYLWAAPPCDWVDSRDRVYVKKVAHSRMIGMADSRPGRAGVADKGGRNGNSLLTCRLPRSRTSSARFRIVTRRELTAVSDCRYRPLISNPDNDAGLLARVAVESGCCVEEDGPLP
jgi:hypothetical protein